MHRGLRRMDKLVSELSGPNKMQVYKRLGMLAWLSVLIWLLVHRDKRYRELENWERNYFWHLPMGDKGPMIRIPKPFEAGILFGSTFERMMEWAYGENVNGIKSALAASWDAATPEVIPTIARPLVELKSNYDFFRGRPIEDLSVQRLPEGLRSKPWTTELAKGVGKVSEAAGVGISPIKLEHWIRAWTAGLGSNYFLPGLDLVLRQAGVLKDIPQPERDTIQKIWGVRAFFTKEPTGFRAKSVNDYFERYQEVVQADQAWKLMWNTGNVKGAVAYLHDHPEAMFARIAYRAGRMLADIKKERQKIYESQSLSPERKRAELDRLDEKILTLGQTANAFWSPGVAKRVRLPRSAPPGMALPDFYKSLAAPVDEVFRSLEGKLAKMEPEQRDAAVAAAINRAIRDWPATPKRPKDSLKEAVKPFMYRDLVDAPTKELKRAMTIPGIAGGL